MTTQTKGIFWGIISAASYGMTPLFAKPLYGLGISVNTVLFYRYSLAALMLAGLVVMRGESLRLRKADLFPLLWMGLVYCFSSLLLFEGYHIMDAGITATIFFAYPVMVAVIMGVFFKEKISKMAWGCLLCTMGGVWLLGETKGTGSMNVWGVSIVLLSALAYVLYMLGVNKTHLRKMDGAKLNFYALSIGAVVFALLLLTNGEGIAAPANAHQWGLYVMLAFVPTVVSLISLTKSIHYIGSTLTAVLGAFEPITALVIGIGVLGEHLTVNNVIGVVTILTAVTLIVSEKQVKKQVWSRVKRRIKK